MVLTDLRLMCEKMALAADCARFRFFLGLNRIGVGRDSSPYALYIVLQVIWWDQNPVESSISTAFREVSVPWPSSYLGQRGRAQAHSLPRDTFAQSRQDCTDGCGKSSAVPGGQAEACKRPVNQNGSAPQLQ